MNKFLKSCLKGFHHVLSKSYIFTFAFFPPKTVVHFIHDMDLHVLPPLMWLITHDVFYCSLNSSHTIFERLADRSSRFINLTWNQICGKEGNGTTHTHAHGGPLQGFSFIQNRLGGLNALHLVIELKLSVQPANFSVAKEKKNGKGPRWILPLYAVVSRKSPKRECLSMFLIVYFLNCFFLGLSGKMWPKKCKMFTKFAFWVISSRVEGFSPQTFFFSLELRVEVILSSTSTRGGSPERPPLAERDSPGALPSFQAFHSCLLVMLRALLFWKNVQNGWTVIKYWGFIIKIAPFY